MFETFIKIFDELLENIEFEKGSNVYDPVVVIEIKRYEEEIRKLIKKI